MRTLFLLLPALALAACGDTGTVRLGAVDATAGQALTDADAAAYAALELRVVDIRLRAEADGGEDGAWTDALVDPVVVDLLALRGGEFQELTTAEVDAGTITEIRLVLDPADPGQAVLADGTTIPLVVPSGTSSGLKIKGRIEVPAGDEVEVRLDFDVDGSLSLANDGTLRLHPVIRLDGATATSVDPAEGESSPE